MRGLAVGHVLGLVHVRGPLFGVATARGGVVDRIIVDGIVLGLGRTLGIARGHRTRKVLAVRCSNFST